MLESFKHDDVNYIAGMPPDDKINYFGPEGIFATEEFHSLIAKRLYNHFSVSIPIKIKPVYSAID